MSAIAATGRRSLRGERTGSRRRGGGSGRGGESLARRIERTWRSLAEHGLADCPVCGQAISAGGDCEGCGAKLG